MGALDAEARSRRGAQRKAEQRLMGDSLRFLCAVASLRQRWRLSRWGQAQQSPGSGRRAALGHRRESRPRGMAARRQPTAESRRRWSGHGRRREDEDAVSGYRP